MKGSLKDVSLVLRKKKKRNTLVEKFLKKKRERGRKKKMNESTIDRQDLSVSVCL